MRKEQCKRCGEWKELTDFSPLKPGMRGRDLWCKICKKKYPQLKIHTLQKKARKRAAARKLQNKRRISDINRLFLHKDNTHVNKKLLEIYLCRSERSIMNYKKHGMPVNPDGTYDLDKIDAWVETRQKKNIMLTWQAIYGEICKYRFRTRKRQCIKCGEWKELKEFHRDKKDIFRRSRWCKSCYHSYFSDWRAQQDYYIRSILKAQFKRLELEITPEMIQEKREQLMVHRALKQLKEEIA